MFRLRICLYFSRKSLLSLSLFPSQLCTKSFSHIECIVARQLFSLALASKLEERESFFCFCPLRKQQQNSFSVVQDPKARRARPRWLRHGGTVARPRPCEGSCASARGFPARSGQVRATHTPSARLSSPSTWLVSARQKRGEHPETTTALAINCFWLHRNHIRFFWLWNFAPYTQRWGKCSCTNFTQGSI